MFISFLMLSVTFKKVVMEIYREPDYEDVYQDADFSQDLHTFLNQPSKRSSLCLFFANNLGFGSLWWLICLLQFTPLLPLLVFYRLCRLIPMMSFITVSSIITFYLNTSLWAWSLYVVVALANCGIGVNNPTFIIGIVFVTLFALLSIIDCLLSKEGWYLVDLKPLKEAIQYFDKLKQSPPVHRIHIECFHTTTMAVTNTRGSIFTRTKKEVTYCDHIDFPLTSWSDLSEWPHLDSIASRGANIIGVSMESKVEPGDIETKEAFEAFKNKFVQQNCHRDVEIKTWVTSEIAEMASEQSLFITTKSKEQTPFIFNIGLYLFLSFCCLGCPLKTYIMKKTKLIPLKVNKVYFFDPNKPSPTHVPSIRNSLNTSNFTDTGEKASQHAKSDYDKVNMMPFVSRNSQENLNYQKVLLNDTSSSSVYTTATTTETKQNTILNITPTITTDNHNTHGPKRLGSNILLLSPATQTGKINSQKSYLLSPIMSSERHVKEFAQTPPVRHTDSLEQETHKMLALDVSTNSSSYKNNLSSSPYCSSSYVHQQKPWNNVQEGSYNTKFFKNQSNNQTDYESMRHSLFSRSNDNRSNYAPLPNTSISWNRTGKEFYDRRIYEDRRFEPLPRTTVLKNTNVEAEIMSRGRQHGRRVHYSLEDDDIDYSDYRNQSPSPEGNERHYHSGVRQHKSRRTFSIDRDHEDIYNAKNDFSFNSNYLLDDEEALYNA